MDLKLIVGLVLALLGMVGAGVGVYYFVFASRKSSLQGLMGRSEMGTAAERYQKLKEGDLDEIEKIKRATKKAVNKKVEATLEEKLFRAGILSEQGRRDFMRFRVLAPVISTTIGLVTGVLIGDATIGIAALVMGLLIGLQLPVSLLQRRQQARDEEIMYYLPLVIEQVSIGVSSSLDVGPCLARIVQMADERDTHNPVTVLVRHAQQYVKSGVSLEESMTEVGKLSGHTELKHAFMSLAQVAKHGGEITRQLQELADAVASQRETKIEGQIKTLELKATGPVALVFMGFLIILLIGFGIQMMKAFE